MRSLVRVLVLGAIVTLVLAFIPALHAKGLDFSKGDEWTYDVTDSYGPLTMVGTMRTSYAGTDTISVNDTTYRVYVVDFNTTMTGEAVLVYTTVSSTVAIDERAYYTVDHMDIIKDVYDWRSHTETTLNGSTSDSSVHEHNVTTFIPPGGFGNWPTSIEVGETWEIAYPSTSVATIDEDGNTSSLVYSQNETISYRYDGTTDISTPAGQFQCQVIDETSSGWSQTSWQSDVAGAVAKLVQRSDSGETVTWLLKTYTYSRGVSKDPAIFYGVGAITAAAGIALVVLVLWRQKRKPTQFTTGLELQTSPVRSLP